MEVVNHARHSLLSVSMQLEMKLRRQKVEVACDSLPASILASPDSQATLDTTNHRARAGIIAKSKPFTCALH